jgi:hypothetical protein
VKLEIPGQFGGPECQPLVGTAVALRRLLEPALASLSGPAAKLVLLLRVGGTLRDFGGRGALLPSFEDDALVCEIEVKAHAWADVTPAEMRTILIRYLLQGIQRCVDQGLLADSVLDEAARVLSR